MDGYRFLMHGVGPDLLTEAECNILGFLRQGYSLSDIAVEILISPQSVKNHLQRAARRLAIPGGAGMAQRILARIDGDALNEEKLLRLQPVQRDIVRQAIKGRSMTQIASDLGLGSASTVKSRMRDIYDRTGASTIGELRSLLVIPSSTKEPVL